MVKVNIVCLKGTEFFEGEEFSRFIYNIQDVNGNSLGQFDTFFEIMTACKTNGYEVID